MKSRVSDELGLTMSNVEGDDTKSKKKFIAACSFQFGLEPASTITENEFIQQTPPSLLTLKWTEVGYAGQKHIPHKSDLESLKRNLKKMILVQTYDPWSKSEPMILDETKSPLNFFSFGSRRLAGGLQQVLSSCLHEECRTSWVLRQAEAQKSEDFLTEQQIRNSYFSTPNEHVSQSRTSFSWRPILPSLLEPSHVLSTNKPTQKPTPSFKQLKRASKFMKLLSTYIRWSQPPWTHSEVARLAGLNQAIERAPEVCRPTPPIVESHRGFL